MADTIQCHSCQKKFRLPANVSPGQKFRCPGCKTVLTVPEPEDAPVDLGAATAEVDEVMEVQEAPAPRKRSEPPPEEDYDEPAEKRGGRESEADAWPLVGQGSTMHLIANAAYLASLLLFLIVFFIGSAEPAPARIEGGKIVRGSNVGGTIAEIMTMILTTAWIGSSVVALIAVGLFLAAPWKNGSRGLAIALLAFSFLAVERSSNPMALAAGGLGGEFGGPSLLNFFMIEGARLTVLALFMKSVGRSVRQSSLTETSGLLAIVTPAALGGMLFICYILTKAIDMGPGLYKTVVILIVLSLAGVVGWSLAVLMSMAAAVRRKGRR
jgi:phage FluMu protein Com